MTPLEDLHVTESLKKTDPSCDMSPGFRPWRLAVLHMRRLQAAVRLKTTATDPD